MNIPEVSFSTIRSDGKGGVRIALPKKIRERCNWEPKDDIVIVYDTEKRTLCVKRLHEVGDRMVGDVVMSLDLKQMVDTMLSDMGMGDVDTEYYNRVLKRVCEDNWLYNKVFEAVEEVVKDETKLERREKENKKLRNHF